jgi:hypothetical protein
MAIEPEKLEVRLCYHTIRVGEKGIERRCYAGYPKEETDRIKHIGKIVARV